MEILFSLKIDFVDIGLYLNKKLKLGKNIGYDSTIIRQLNDYILENEKDDLLLPYSKLLFNNENPKIICELINKLSSISLYLYGNELN